VPHNNRHATKGSRGRKGTGRRITTHPNKRRNRRKNGDAPRVTGKLASPFPSYLIKSLDEVYTDHSLLFQDVTPSPEEATHQSQLRKMLAKAISKLPEREALVLQLYYVEKLNVYEVAAVLGVTTGRVSQIKRAAIERAHSLIMEQMDP
jgi:RNA polymerase sigma factor (sigma-70 family)